MTDFVKHVRNTSVHEVMADLPHSDPMAATICTKHVERAHLAELAADRVEVANDGKSVPRPEQRETPEGEFPNVVRFLEASGSP